MKKKSKKLLVISVDRNDILPDNNLWQNRFEIRSESSNRLYIIAQHKTKKHWGCSCPSWRIRRTCKHLDALGLPGLEQPMEIKLIGK